MKNVVKVDLRPVSLTDDEKGNKLSDKLFFLFFFSVLVSLVAVPSNEFIFKPYHNDSHTSVLITKSSYVLLTFKVLWTADELDAWEQWNSAWQQHCKTAHLHITFLACRSASLIPSNKRPTTWCIVDMIEQAAFWHQQSVRLEWSFCGWHKVFCFMFFCLLLCFFFFGVGKIMNNEWIKKASTIERIRKIKLIILN